MKKLAPRFFIVYLALALSACAMTPKPTSLEKPSSPFGWLVGCWNSASGDEEFWRLTQHGDQLFGYAITVKSGERVFFEQMRLDVDGDKAVFHAYPRGLGPTAFAGTLTGAASAEFTNADNDYPQRIRYELTGGQLLGTISLMDGSNVNEWRYQRCAD